ncbi:MAG TPA: hypothetical protein VEZ12_22125, partial [Herpetosiphonaceae bacterium]|nr:hypothetical protein [Herpetosiphonaceae bacterium]
FDHFVVSLDRRDPELAHLLGWLGRDIRVSEQPFDHGIAAEYRAPARGPFHARALDRLGDWLAERIAERPGPRVAVLIGHKLTVEDRAVRRAADLLGVPYLVDGE